MTLLHSDDQTSDVKGLEENYEWWSCRMQALPTSERSLTALITFINLATPNSRYVSVTPSLALQPAPSWHLCNCLQVEDKVYMLSQYSQALAQSGQGMSANMRNGVSQTSAWAPPSFGRPWCHIASDRGPFTNQRSRVCQNFHLCRYICFYPVSLAREESRGL